MTHESICALFGTTGDFIARELRCGGHTVHAYMIDGLIASATAGETILKPLSRLPAVTPCDTRKATEKLLGHVLLIAQFADDTTCRNLIIVHGITTFPQLGYRILQKRMSMMIDKMG